MPIPLRLSGLLIALLLSSGILHGQPSALPDPRDPVAGTGINIHFTDPAPGELEMLAKGGFRWIRTDIFWQQTEKSPGVYDFSAYDRLLTHLDAFHIRALLVLDYSNPLYDQNLPPHTDLGRAAFTKWAIAAVTHFKNRGIIWEIWNEPNGVFWIPKNRPEEYSKLALSVSQGLRQAVPNEQIVGPGLSGTDVSFLDVLGRDGVLAYWSAITIHPYRRSGPETYGPAYDITRRLAREYAAPDQHLEVLCGESGYCCTWAGLDETLQAKYLARLFLFDVLSAIPITIWYDWRDDGDDPGNSEHHFGIVHNSFITGAALPYDPKPAYAAARTYSENLAGYRFKERMNTASDNDFVLSFTKGSTDCLAAWTTTTDPHPVEIKLPDGIYVATNYDGTRQTEVASTGGVMILTLDDGPLYLKRQ